MRDRRDLNADSSARQGRGTPLGEHRTAEGRIAGEYGSVSLFEGEVTVNAPNQTLETEAAAGGDSSGQGGTQLQLVTFDIGQEHFAVDILAVQEINRMMQITRVPQAPDCLEGVINLRGRIIPVVDLRKRFGLETCERNSESRIVVVEISGRVIGFIVDRVNEVLRVESDVVEPAPAFAVGVNSEYVRGVAKLEEQLVILLDLAKLFDVNALTASAAAA